MREVTGESYEDSNALRTEIKERYLGCFTAIADKFNKFTYNPVTEKYEASGITLAIRTPDGDTDIYDASFEVGLSQYGEVVFLYAEYYTGDMDASERTEITVSDIDSTEVELPKATVSPTRGFTYALSDDETYYTVSGIDNGKARSLVFASEHLGLPVKAIGDGAFKDNYEIRKIYLSDSIEEIGVSAFENCMGTEYIALGRGLKKIGAHAFDGVDTRVEMIFYDSLEEIGEDAFYTHTSYGIRGKLYFYGDINKYAQIKIANSYATLDFNRDFYCNDALLEGELTLDTASYVGDYAFTNISKFTKIKLGTNIQSIGKFAFALEWTDTAEIEYDGMWEDWCRIRFGFNWGSGHVAIALYYSLKEESEKNLFIAHGGWKLTCAGTLIENVTFDRSITEVQHAILNGCVSVKTVTLHDGITEIGRAAFAGCENLQSVALSENLQYIGECAFFGTSPETASLYNGILYLGSENNPYLYAFRRAKGTTACRLHSDTKVLAEELFCECKELSEAQLPEGILQIGSHAFALCPNLTEIALPTSLEYIDRDAFYGTERITNATLPLRFSDAFSIKKVKILCITDGDTLTRLSTPDLEDLTLNVTTVDCALQGLKKLRKVTLGDKVTSIGNSFFASSAKEVVIGRGLGCISKEAFLFCAELETVRLADNILYIDDNAFGGCGNLTQIELPDGLNAIGSGAFANCVSLQSITVPESVRQIRKDAFEMCSALRHIDFNAINCGTDEYGYVFPHYAGEEFTVTVGKNVTRIQDYMFRESNITRLTFAEGSVCQRIGVGAFLECKLLSAVSFPDALARIDDSAFCCCRALTAIRLPDSVKELGENAFDDCIALDEIVVGSGISRLPEHVFHLAPMKYIILSSTVTTIEDGALYHESVYERNIFFSGTEYQWEKISVGENNLSDGDTVYFFSQSAPEQEGNYWHYESDGRPVVWE